MFIIKMIKSGLVNQRRARFENGYPHQVDENPRDEVVRPYVQGSAFPILGKSEYAKPSANPPNLVQTKYNDIFGKRTTPDERLYLLKEFTAAMNIAKQVSAPGRNVNIGGVPPPASNGGAPPSIPPGGGPGGPGGPSGGPSGPSGPDGPPTPSILATYDYTAPNVTTDYTFKNELEAQVLMDAVGNPAQVTVKEEQDALAHWEHHLSASWAVHRNPTLDDHIANGVFSNPADFTADILNGDPTWNAQKRKDVYTQMYHDTDTLPNVTNSATQTRMESQDGSPQTEVTTRNISTLTKRHPKHVHKGTSTGAHKVNESETQTELVHLINPHEKREYEDYKEIGLGPDEFSLLGNWLRDNIDNYLETERNRMKYHNVEGQYNESMQKASELYQQTLQNLRDDYAAEVARARQSKMALLEPTPINATSYLPQGISERQVSNAERANKLKNPARRFGVSPLPFRSESAIIKMAKKALDKAIKKKDSKMQVDEPSFGVAPGHHQQNPIEISSESSASTAPIPRRKPNLTVNTTGLPNSGRPPKLSKIRMTKSMNSSIPGVKNKRK